MTPTRFPRALSPRLVLFVLVGVVVASLTATVTLILVRGAGDGFDKVESLREGEVPATEEREDREAVLELARRFSVQLNTYDPGMLDPDGNLPDYAALTDLMSPKFDAVFTADGDQGAWQGVEVIEEIVKSLDATSTAEVHAVGVATIDPDSATVIVGGVLEVSRPVPGSEGGAQGEDPQQVSSGPRQFRYEVYLVKTEGEWLVDDLDDVDDGRPSLVDSAESAAPESPTEPVPSEGQTGGTTDQPSQQGSRKPRQEGTEQ